MTAGLDNLELLMLVGSIGVFLFLASVIIFLLEEAGTMLLHSLRDAILHTGDWLLNQYRHWGHPGSGFHDVKP